jgi:hypothetical protein
MESFSTAAELVAHLREHAGDEQLTNHQEFQSAFDQFPKDLALTELNEVIRYAGEQYGRWRARRDFASVSAPDAKAQQEVDKWDSAWKTFSDELTGHQPDLRKLHEEERTATLLAYTLERSVEHNRTQPPKEHWAPLVSFAARVFHSLGAQRIAQELQSIALYPPGSVGRGP